MKPVQILLMFGMGAYLAKGVTVTPNEPLIQVFPITNPGFCYEVTKKSGDLASAYFLKGDDISASHYDSKSELQTNVTVFYFQAPYYWGASYNVSIALLASGSDVEVDLLTKNLNPCDPNPCSYHDVCVPKPGCTSECVAAPLYDCATNSPCTAANVNAGNYFFANEDVHKYIQCAAVDVCYLMSCGSTLVWSQQAQACVWP